MTDLLVSDVVAELERAYPPALAESWDSIGLVCGDLAEPVNTVMLAVDATESVVDEAITAGVHLLVTHHPLLLRGVDTVGAHTPKGRLIHKLIRSGCALFTAHTNADSADPGVSDALAAALGLSVTGPLDPQPSDPLDKWAVMVPDEYTDAVRAALFDAGAGRIGNYENCSWTAAGFGQFLPVGEANPAVGAVGELEQLPENRVEVIAPRRLRTTVLAALRSAHPYEEVAFDVFEMAELPSAHGLGRVGTLPHTVTLREFTDTVARALPTTAWGVRCAGNPDTPVRTVAVCGGAGDSFLDTVIRLGVDAYVTSDLRHHPADEHLRTGGPVLIDVAHWASEFPWCGQAKGVLDAAFGEAAGLDVRICDVRTDPWTYSAR